VNLVIAFVRHGETPPNRDGLVLGRADPGLTEEGRRQAQRLAEVFGNEAVSAVLTSPLARARETAETIAAACGLRADSDERLVEIDWGEWEGRSVAGLASAEVERWRAESGTAPEGESLRSVCQRMASFCTEALERDGMVVAVSHVSPIKAAVAWALGADDDVAWRMFLGLASITRVARRSAGPCLVSFNETAHLR
jgi:broad specificity phosphatase PhoE